MEVNLIARLLTTPTSLLRMKNTVPACNSSSTGSTTASCIPFIMSELGWDDHDEIEYYTFNDPSKFNGKLHGVGFSRLFSNVTALSANLFSARK